MYLEVHRWKNLTKSFRFNPGPPLAGATIRPRPGLPLRALFVCAALSPPVFATVIAAMAPTRAVALREKSGHLSSDWKRMRPHLRGAEKGSRAERCRSWAPRSWDRAVDAPIAVPHTGRR